MTAGTGEDQAASAPATPEPATMVQAGDGSALPGAVRQHTGRRRNAAARDAILDVTFELHRTRGTTGLTIDAIAEAAGVGRQTISRGAGRVHRPAPGRTSGPARAGPGQRGPAADANLDLLVDVAYGVLWYRLLIGHAPLDPRAARDLAAHLLAAGAAGLADAAQPSRPGEGG